jgi:Rps23 Pro-64 3,4-dihydroxylase Tpa1-like proline 4-hydroxylase/glycosyltransferase involved in cell wall biosynthesis
MLNLKMSENEIVQYSINEPFPHIVIDNFIEEPILTDIVNEFQNFSNWGYDNSEYSKNYQVNKFFAPWDNSGLTNLPVKTKTLLEYFNSTEFLTILENLTGIKGLISDPELIGGGMHRIDSGGKLSIHVDFNKHHTTGNYRRINLLLYLNKEWDQSWGGSLQLWDKDVKLLVKDIQPIFNRVVIFNTDVDTYHGHPHPLNTPKGISRYSLALYYYTKDNPEPNSKINLGALWKEIPTESKKNRPTLAFATMCKNEEHVIGQVLDAVAPYIDYLLVADNGSTDRTLEIVQEFMDRTGISGEIVRDEWKSFGENKTMMMEYVYGKTDYVMHLDADDILDGEFSFTNEDIGYDNYYMTMTRGGSTYLATVIYNNRLRWKFCGVAHTIIKCLDKENISTGNLSDRGHVICEGVGSRAFDPKKFYYDAEKLQKQFWDTLINDPDGLNHRSVFYTAQSYMDYGMFDEALKWNRLYTKLENTWIEERFEAQMRVSVCMMKLDFDFETIYHEMLKAINIFSDRAEPHYKIGVYANQNNRFDVSYKHLKMASNLSLGNAQEKYILFVDNTCYGKNVNDELSVSCYWTERYEEGLKYLMEIIEDPSFSIHKERLNDNYNFFMGKLNNHL